MGQHMSHWNELDEVYRPETEPTVDVVAIHGLRGHYMDTWTTDDLDVCLLDDLLPKYIPSARILSWGYNSQVSNFGGQSLSLDRIAGMALRLVETLYANRARRKATTRPIIFIAHSIGGIVLKMALVHSARQRAPETSHLSTISLCTHGILFFGTPHYALPKAPALLPGMGDMTFAIDDKLTNIFIGDGDKAIPFFGAPQNAPDNAPPAVLKQSTPEPTEPKTGLSTEAELAQILAESSEVLKVIAAQFEMIMFTFRMFFFWEEVPMDLGDRKDFIVTSKSAAPLFCNADRSGIPANHRQMARFDSAESPGFKTMIDSLQRYVKEAPDFVQTRLV